MSHKEFTCDTHIELRNAPNQSHLASSLHEIMAIMDGFLSRYMNGQAVGSTCSPVLNLTININAPMASGGGAIAKVVKS